MFEKYLPLVYNFGITNKVPVCHFCPALVQMSTTICYDKHKYFFFVELVHGLWILLTFDH